MKNDKKILVNGVTLHYNDFGKGDVPIIFIHGFPFDKSMWKHQLSFLKSTHRVIAYDIRGFGKSTSNNEKASIALFADDLIMFMDALNIPKAFVCGISMGGYILLNAISRFPERFEGIILCDTQCIPDSPETKEKRMKTIERIETEGLTTFVEAFVQNVFCKNSFVSNIKAIDEIKSIMLSTNPQTIIDSLLALAGRNETCSILETISVPTLILCGAEDIVTPPEQAEFLNRNIKNSKKYIIEHAGHMSNLEQVEVFNREVLSFVGN